LFVGIVVIASIYFFGRKFRQKKRQDNDIFDDDLPAFNAKNWDDFDEGVGPVKIISGDNPVSADSNVDENSEQQSDIVMLYILPKLDGVFQGSQINSSVQAMGLKFGDMNIYHYSKLIENEEDEELSGESQSRMVFSLANMHEPGFFDPETIHELTSTGLIVFMQINTSSSVDALDDLTEMLQRSYQIAGLIDGRLCNHKQQPLTEQDAQRYREQVRVLTTDASSPETLAEL